MSETRQYELMNSIQHRIREMIAMTKTKKARKSAPSQWTEYLGWSSNPLGYNGFYKEAPFSASLAFSDCNFRVASKKELFFMIAEALEKDYKHFAEIFKVAGRVDLKYNSTISPEDNHFDKKDSCHQVFFTFGDSNQKLCVQERTVLTKLSGFFTPTAFDGRFQHWVEERKDMGPSDRISVVCYLVDVPGFYKHSKMTAEEIKIHLGELSKHSTK